MNDESYLEDELNITVYHSLYMFYQAQIRALEDLKKQRKYGANAIDLMYIPTITSFVESVLSEIFDDYLGMNAKKFSEKQVQSVSQKLCKGTWEVYKSCFKFLFKVKLKKVVGTEVLKAIEAIFLFRNQSIHGKQIQHKLSHIGDMGVESALLAGHYEQLNRYFLEKELLTKEDLSSVRFINDKVVNHFLENVKLFVQALAENIMKAKDLKMYDGFKKYVIEQL